MGTDPPVGEISQGVSPPGGAADEGHGTKTSTGWDMGVYTHWGSAGNGRAGGDRGVYRPPPEHSRTVHCDSSYHGLVSGGGSESGTAPIQLMVGSSCPVYPGDKGRDAAAEGGRGRGRGRGRGSNNRRAGESRAGKEHPYVVNFDIYKYGSDGYNCDRKKD